MPEGSLIFPEVGTAVPLPPDMPDSIIRTMTINAKGAIAIKIY
jgi:hypothetical protein